MISAESKQRLTALANKHASNLEAAEPYLISRGIAMEAAAMFGLGYVTEGQYVGRLSIPYWTPTGVVAIKYRRTDSDGDSPKYLYEPGGGVHLYNAQALIRASDVVVVTEGELDSVCVQAYLGVPAVGYPGVDTFKKMEHFRHCFEGIAQVVVVADGDTVGRNAARAVADKIGMSARVCELSKGEDSNSFLQAHGVQAFREKLGL